MKRVVNQYLSICAVTVSEAARQPICILLTGASVLMATLLPFVLTHQFGEAGRLVRDSSLSLHLVPGLFLSSFLACLVFHNEMRSGTAGVILCKPVNRSVFFVAKFSGIALIVIGYSICMMCTTVLVSLAARESYVIQWWAELPLLMAFAGALLVGGCVNYILRKPFPSSTFLSLCLLLLLALMVGVVSSKDAGWDLLSNILPAGILITMACLVLGAIASCLSLVFRVIPTVLLCGIVFIAGLLMDYLYAVVGAESFIVRSLFYVLPNWQRFWVADAISGGSHLPWEYGVLAVAYGTTYLGGVLCAGIILFNYVELDRR